MLLKTIKESLTILLIALVAAVGMYILRPDALPPGGSPSTPETGLTEDALYKSIGIDKAEEMFGQGSALFADARSVAAYEEGHIAGAIQLDPQDFETWSADIVARYPPEQVIIAYCQGAQCDLSRLLAERLTWLGFEKVYYLIDGWGQWQQRGLPME